MQCNYQDLMDNQLAFAITFQAVDDGNAVPKMAYELSVGDTILDGNGNEAVISSISYDGDEEDSYAIFTADGQVSIALSNQIIDTISNKDGRKVSTTPAQMIEEGIIDANGKYRFRFPYIDATTDEREAILSIIAAECTDLNIAISDDGYPIYMGYGYDDLNKLSYAYDLAHTAGIATSRIIRDDEMATTHDTSDCPTSYLEILTHDNRILPLDSSDNKTARLTARMHKAIIDSFVQHIATPDTDATLSYTASDDNCVTFEQAGRLYSKQTDDDDELKLIKTMFRTKTVKTRRIPKCIIDTNVEEKAAFLKGIVEETVSTAIRNEEGIHISLEAKAGTPRYESLIALLDGLEVKHFDDNDKIVISNPPLDLFEESSRAYELIDSEYNDIAGNAFSSDIKSSAIVDIMPCGKMESMRIATIRGDRRAATAEGFVTVL